MRHFAVRAPARIADCLKTQTVSHHHPNYNNHMHCYHRIRLIRLCSMAILAGFVIPQLQASMITCDPPQYIAGGPRASVPGMTTDCQRICRHSTPAFCPDILCDCATGATETQVTANPNDDIATTCASGVYKAHALSTATDEWCQSACAGSDRSSCYAAYCYCVARKAMCWGSNIFGELGAGISEFSSLTPVDVILSGVAGLSMMPLVDDISGKMFSACAVLESGKITCWGLNAQGQSGTGLSVGRFHKPEATAVGIDTAVQVAAGGYHTCAVLQNGSVWCWGLNSDGQLGIGTTQSQALPVEVSLPGPARSVTTSNYFTCAALRDGRVFCWGRNSDGEIGDGSFNSSSVPRQVLDITNAFSVHNSHITATCALLVTRRVKCWGRNYFGLLGHEPSVIYRSAVPVLVPNLSDVKELSVGSLHACAALMDGRVKCWGTNNLGQLGRPVTPPLTIPLPDFVPGVTGAIAISSGENFSCAVKSNGVIVCWGGNEFGQLGDDTKLSRSTPESVVGIDSALDVSAGGRYVCAVIDTTNIT